LLWALRRAVTSTVQRSPAAIRHFQIDVARRLGDVLLAPRPTDPVFVILEPSVILIGIVLALWGSLISWWLRQAPAAVKLA